MGATNGRTRTRRIAMALAAGACGLAVAQIAVSQGATPSALMQRFVVVPRSVPRSVPSAQSPRSSRWC